MVAVVRFNIGVSSLDGSGREQIRVFLHSFRTLIHLRGGYAGKGDAVPPAVATDGNENIKYRYRDSRRQADDPDQKGRPLGQHCKVNTSKDMVGGAFH